MKRALTGIAAAAVVLGTIAPAAFASTAPALTAGGGKTISLDGTTLYSGVQVGNAKDAGTTTTYFPIWYLQQALTKAGYTNTYNPSTATWDITMPGVDASKVTVDGGVGSGNSAISINGTVVKKFNAQWAKDLAGGKNASVTTYFPVYYLGNVLAAAGFSNAWDGNSFGFKSYVAPTFGVKSVTAVNPEEVDVTFTQPVDPSQDFSGVTVKNLAGFADPGALSYSLSDDGKTLSITTTNAMSQGGYYTVGLTKVLDANRNVTTPYSTTVQLNDKTAPSITSVSGATNQSSTRSFTVSFSEPTQLDNVQVNGVFASATSSDGGWDYTIALPSTADALNAGQTYNFTITGLRDLVGNYAANPLASSVTITQDTTAPTFTVSAVNPKQLTVVFNKKMTTSPIPVDGVTVKDAAGNVLPLAGLPSFKSDKKTLVVNLAGSAVPSGFTSSTVSVEVKNYQDSLGNAVKDTTNTVTVSKSTTKPAITSVRVIDASTIEATFNEHVTFNATPGNTFFITDSTKATAATVSSIDPQDAYNRVVLHLAAPISETDTFTLALAVNTVSDASGNNNDAGTSTFSYSAAAPSTVTASVYSHNDTTPGVATNSSTNKQVVVYFNANNVVYGLSSSTGNYKTGAADNAANYTLDGSALPQGTTVTFVNNDANNGGNDAVVIDFTGVSAANLPSEFANGGTGTLTVSGVQSTVGGTLTYTSSPVNVADTTAPSISSAYVTGSSSAGYTLTVKMSEKIDSTYFGSGLSAFTVLANGTTITTPDAVTLGSDGVTVTYKINTTNGQFSTVQSNLSKLTVATAGSEIKDLATSPNTTGTGTAVNVIDYATN